MASRRQRPCGCLHFLKQTLALLPSVKRQVFCVLNFLLVPPISLSAPAELAESGQSPKFQFASFLTTLPNKRCILYIPLSCAVAHALGWWHHAIHDRLTQVQIKDILNQQFIVRVRLHTASHIQITTGSVSPTARPPWPSTVALGPARPIMDQRRSVTQCP